jgi:hypothetical protein
MTVSTLEKIIDTTLLSKLYRASGSASQGSASKGELTGQALYTSLRTGARNFAAGYQLLSQGSTFLNVSLDTNERLLDVVKSIQQMVDKANRGNLSASEAKQDRRKIDQLSRDFDGIVDAARAEKVDPLDTQSMEDTLVRAGLDKEKISDLANLLKKISSPTESSIAADGTVTSDGNPIPLDEIQRQLRAAVFDEDEPTDDKSGFFTKVKAKLRDVQLSLERNVKAIKGTINFVKENMAVARVAGLAFLDASNDLKGTESADAIAEVLRGKIRAGSGSALGQAHNLESVMVAGLAALGEQKA